MDLNTYVALSVDFTTFRVKLICITFASTSVLGTVYSDMMLSTTRLVLITSCIDQNLGSDCELFTLY